jgi:foldase protein PrsA
MKQLITTAILLLPIVMGCEQKPKETFALSVNGHNIKNDEINRTIEFIRQSMQQMSPGALLESVSPEMRKNAARQLIANDLMIAEAQRRGLNVDSSIVENVFTKFKGQFGSDETFKSEIAKMGETETGIRKQMHEGALIDTLLKSLFVTIDTIDSESMKVYYEKNKDKYTLEPRVRASQIFFPFDSVTSTEDGKKALLKKAESVLGMARSGSDFKKLAAKYSNGPGATEGGDIGWFGSQDLRPDLSTPLYKLNKGEISDVVASEMGYHILMKTDVDESKIAGFDEVKDHISMVLKMKKQNDFLNAFIDSLIVKAHVVYHDTSLVPGVHPDSVSPKL